LVYVLTIPFGYHINSEGWYSHFIAGITKFSSLW